MSELALSSHGIEIAMELDVSGSAGTFTAIAELLDFEWPEVSRPTTEVTAHADKIDYYVVGRLMRGPITFDVNLLYAGATHEHATGGLYKKIFDGELTGYRIRGPGGTDDTDEWILSGFVTNIGGRSAAAREGSIGASITIQPSGDMIIDGATIVPV